MQFIRTKWTSETLKRGLEPEQSVVLFCNNKRFYGVYLYLTVCYDGGQDNCVRAEILHLHLAYSLLYVP